MKTQNADNSKIFTSINDIINYYTHTSTYTKSLHVTKAHEGFLCRIWLLLPSTQSGTLLQFGRQALHLLSLLPTRRQRLK